MAEIRKSTEETLAACGATLDAEAGADAASRARYGARWNVAPSAQLSRPFWDKITSYRCA